MISIQDAISSLTSAFAPLDNSVEKWRTQGTALQANLPDIRASLQTAFGTEIEALALFDAAVQTYATLLVLVEQNPIAAGFHNLRFYILLNGFLSGVNEIEQRMAGGAGMPLSEALQRNDFQPFFYAKAHLTTDEVRAMLSDDLAELAELPDDKKGAIAALRIKKGVVSTLTESYCPLHPLVYPAVYELDQVEHSYDAAMIRRIMDTINALQNQLGTWLHDNQNE